MQTYHRGDIVCHIITGEHLRVLHLAENGTLHCARVEPVSEHDAVATVVDRVASA